jgi:hypothetical protein
MRPAYLVARSRLSNCRRAIAERQGASGEIGAELLALQQQLFAQWHRYKDGTIDWPTLHQACVPIRQMFVATLQQVVELGYQRGERTPWAKTVGTCQKLLPVADGLWTFLKIKGIEPTNNVAERALRQSRVRSAAVACSLSPLPCGNKGVMYGIFWSRPGSPITAVA